jgi:hypothetical protein
MNDRITTQGILDNLVRDISTALLNLNPICTDAERIRIIQVAWLDATEAMMNTGNQPSNIEAKLRALEYRFVQHITHDHKP